MKKIAFVSWSEWFKRTGSTSFFLDLLKKNFEILYYQKDYNLAKYKNENPLIIRVIAKHK